MVVAVSGIHTIVGLGELLWDLFPDGERLGGAPANVAYHATVLGDRGVVATVVGDDERGSSALSRLSESGVDVSQVQRDSGRATGVARVSFPRPGEPQFEFSRAAAWTAPSWTAGWEALFTQARVVCFGTLFCAQPAGRRVVERAASVAPEALRLLDLNLRPPCTPEDAVDAALACASAVKLNEAEADLLATRFGVNDAAAWLLSSRDLRAVAVTRGARGAELITPDGRWSHPGFGVASAGPEARRNNDTVGAGDAFTAALCHHLIRDHAPDRALAAANRYAAFVASRPGAMPPVPEAVRQEAVRGGQ
jgi:fructokinase